MSEFKLRFATDELERALRQQENARLAWLVARSARPAEVDIDAMEAYCWASNEAAEAQRAYDLAQAEAQLDWQRQWDATHGHPGSEARAEGASSLDVGESPAETLSPGLAHRSVRLTVNTFSRED